MKKYKIRLTGLGIEAVAIIPFEEEPTIERPDGTWYTDTITDIDDDTASSVDIFLTEYCEDKEKENDRV